MHIPVLTKEVLEYLEVRPNKNFVDCTTGEGGHTLAILGENGPKGKVLGIEADSELYEKTKKKSIERLVLVNDSYTNLKNIVTKNDFGPVHGILFDLGLSAWHLKESGRGFTFSKDEPLDMRYSTECKMSNVKCQSDSLTAVKIVNEWEEPEIEKVIKIYGEERFSKRIARLIIERRQIKSIKTTLELVDIIKKAVPKNYEKGRIHPATRTFQALRIAVNNELQNLHQVLPQAIDVLEKGGRLAVISFHSLEDKIVKYFFETGAKDNLLQILTEEPLRPSKEEVKNNPSARSAKLQAAYKKI